MRYPASEKLEIIRQLERSLAPEVEEPDLAGELLLTRRP